MDMWKGSRQDWFISNVVAVPLHALVWFEFGRVWQIISVDFLYFLHLS